MAYTTHVENLNEVCCAYNRVVQDNASAHHVMCAYRVLQGDKILHGSVDDGEFGAGITLETLIENHSIVNAVVFVV